MRSWLGRSCAVVAVAASAPLVFAAGASAAAPRYIMVTGPSLQQPVLLDDWWENLRFMQAVSYGTSIGAPRVARRPRFLVSLFWDANVWTEPPTRPDGANERGWFYPAYGKRPAAFEMDRSWRALGFRRVATSELLTIFRAHGVPTRCAVKPNARICSQAG